MSVVGVSGVNALIQKKSKYYILPPAILLSLCFPKVIKIALKATEFTNVV